LRQDSSSSIGDSSRARIRRTASVNVIRQGSVVIAYSVL
jgi:hypothetical protein